MNWIIHDLKRVVAKIGPNKKLSRCHGSALCERPSWRCCSAEFTCDGEWYLDLFPSGYRTEEPETISIYLHSSRRQVSIRLAQQFEQACTNLKTRLSSGLFPKCGSDSGWRKWILQKRWMFRSQGTNWYREQEQDDPKYENVWFPPGSSCVSTFTPSKKYPNWFRSDCLLRL